MARRYRDQPGDETLAPLSHAEWAGGAHQGRSRASDAGYEAAIASITWVSPFAGSVEALRVRWHLGNGADAGW
jgi:hypothetical protein